MHRVKSYIFFKLKSVYNVQEYVAVRNYRCVFADVCTYQQLLMFLSESLKVGQDDLILLLK